MGAPSRCFRSSYVPALDGLRGLAVLLVIGHHLAAYVPVDGASIGAVTSAFRFGWAGVDLFFVLSGFLITGILYDHRDSPTLLGAFYARRILRIAPLYYTFLALYLVGVWAFGSPELSGSLADATPWHLAYLTNVRVALTDTWLAAPAHTLHLWSLAVEEQFYLLWPAVTVMVGWWASSPRKALMWACGGLVVASLAFRIWILPYTDLGAYVLLAARMDALAVGAFVALWVRGPAGIAPALRASWAVLGVGGVALLVLAAWSAGLKSYLHPVQQTVGYTVWAVVWAGVLVRAVAAQRGALVRSLTVRPLLATGRLSYGLYVVHYPALFVLHEAGVAEAGFVALCVSVVVVSYALAALSWRVVEAPAIALKHRFPYGGPAPAAPAVVARAG